MNPETLFLLEEKWRQKCQNEFGIYDILLNNWFQTYRLLVETDMFNLNDEFTGGYTYRMIYLKQRNESKFHKYEDLFLLSNDTNKSECPTIFRYLNQKNILTIYLAHDFLQTIQLINSELNKTHIIF